MIRNGSCRNSHDRPFSLVRNNCVHMYTSSRFLTSTKTIVILLELSACEGMFVLTTCILCNSNFPKASCLQYHQAFSPSIAHHQPHHHPSPHAHHPPLMIFIDAITWILSACQGTMAKRFSLTWIKVLVFCQNLAPRITHGSQHDRLLMHALEA